MRATARDANPARVAALWFGVQLVWGAILGISLQARSAELAGAGSLVAYGRISFEGALAAAIVQLVVGPWSDRLRLRGDRRVGFYAAGVVLGACAIVAFYLARDVAMLGIAFVGLQIALNVAIGPYQAILPDTVRGERLGVASGWMAAMQSAGNAAGALLASALGGVALGVAIAGALLAASAVTLAHVRNVPLRDVAPEEKVAFSRMLADLFISRALFFLGFYTLLGYLFFYVRALLPVHAPIPATTASGVCILLFTLAGALGAALGAKPTDRIDERLVVTVGGAVIAASVAALAWLHMLVALPIAIVVAGAGWGIFICADWAFACRLLPRAALATTMAVWNLAIVVPQMLAPVIATAALARMGALEAANAPRIAFALSAVEILIGAAWIWRLPNRHYGK